MHDFDIKLGNGYVLQKVYANECDGIYGDISENKAEIEKLYPGDNILEGYVVIESATNLTPNNCNDWNNTIEDATRDYEEHVVPTIITLPEDVRWFALDENKCISLWFSPDSYNGNQFLMKLEERAADGSMGPHCKVISDESYGTRNLTFEALCEPLYEICLDTDIKTNNMVNFVIDLAEEIFSSYDLPVGNDEIIYISPQANYTCNLDSPCIEKGSVVERIPAHYIKDVYVKDSISIRITDKIYFDGLRKTVNETKTYYDSNDLYVKSFNVAKVKAKEVYEKIEFIKNLPRISKPMGHFARDYFAVIDINILTDQELLFAKQLAKEFVGPQSFAVKNINCEMQKRFENNVKMSLSDKIAFAKSNVLNNKIKENNIQHKDIIL